MGTSMGTPMAPNYANIFMDKFENDVITVTTKKRVLHLLYGYFLYGHKDLKL